MNEQEHSKPVENQPVSITAIGYIRHLREEINNLYQYTTEKIKIGCEGMLVGMVASGIGGGAIKVGLDQQAPLMIIGGAGAIVMGLGIIILSFDSEQSSYN